MVSNILNCHPYLGKIPYVTNIFSNGLVQPPTRKASDRLPTTQGCHELGSLCGYLWPPWGKPKLFKGGSPTNQPALMCSNKNRLSLRRYTSGVNIAPENEWLEDDCVLLVPDLFSGINSLCLFQGVYLLVHILQRWMIYASWGESRPTDPISHRIHGRYIYLHLPWRSTKYT